jgi:hypothetical protein
MVAISVLAAAAEQRTDGSEPVLRPGGTIVSASASQPSGVAPGERSLPQPGRSLFRSREVTPAQARGARARLDADDRLGRYRFVDIDFDALGGPSFNPAQQTADFASEVWIGLFDVVGGAGGVAGFGGAGVTGAGGAGGATGFGGVGVVNRRARRDRVDLLRDGYAWVGHLDGEPPSNVALVVRDGMLTGTINTMGATYEINGAGEGAAAGIHYIAEVQLAAGAGTELPPIPVAAPPAVADFGAQADAETSVDLLVVYTPAARALAGGKAAIEGAIVTGNTNLNTAHVNSGVANTVNLIHMEEVPYVEAGSPSYGGTDLVRLQAAAGALSRAHLLRDAYGADLVTLIVEYSPFTFCGVAYLMTGPPSTGFAPWAFAVTNRGCISGHTFAHEIGHNWGNNHAPEDPTGAGAFTYSFGFKNPSDLFRTVMAYPCSPPGGSCPRLLYWSNPDVTYGGNPTGNNGPCVPNIGMACTAQNNALSVTNSRAAVANFRTALTSPPAAPALSSPSGSGTDTTPTYIWNHVSDSSWYYLWVEGPTSDGVLIQQWYNAAEICAGGTCAVTPPTTLFLGTHKAWVRPWNHVGNGPWSARKDFTITAPTAPGAATLTAPAGTITDTTPTYTWNAVLADPPQGDPEIAGDAATWYYLWVDGPGGNVIKQWFTAAGAGCVAGGTCSVTPGTELTGGDHSWWIRTWNEAGQGPWSARADFTVATAPPAAATLVSPLGDIADTTPAYTWNAVSGSTWYYLWVDGPGGNVIKQWYTADAVGCPAGTGTCSITPSTVLAAGEHDWWIRTWNPLGQGPWSPRGDFNVLGPFDDD